MIMLRPIAMEEINALDGSSYGAMSLEERAEMIMESQSQLHAGNYFEFLVVYRNKNIIGFMSLQAKSADTISCSPEIKPEFRQRGYGLEAERLALQYARKKGFTMAVSHVREANTASQRLHEKLGFKFKRKYVNKNNRMVLEYSKVL